MGLRRLWWDLGRLWEYLGRSGKTWEISGEPRQTFGDWIQSKPRLILPLCSIQDSSLSFYNIQTTESMGLKKIGKDLEESGEIWGDPRKTWREPGKPCGYWSKLLIFNKIVDNQQSSGLGRSMGLIGDSIKTLQTPWGHLKVCGET